MKKLSINNLLKSNAENSVKKYLLGDSLLYHILLLFSDHYFSPYCQKFVFEVFITGLFNRHVFVALDVRDNNLFKIYFEDLHYRYYILDYKSCVSDSRSCMIMAVILYCAYIMNVDLYVKV